MAVGEFELIQHYFVRPELSADQGKGQGKYTNDLLGIGDDCALLTIPPDMQLAQSLDTLVEGVHFPRECDPYALGYRALAVNLSDLAAMGAEPHSFTMGLTLPDPSEVWLQGFSDGLSKLAMKAGIALIGGDTTRGPLTLSLQVQGLVPRGKALLRSGARSGDLVCVTGTLGDAAGALPFVLAGESARQQEDDSLRYLLTRYWFPCPRLTVGQWLRENGASAALDISDGLLGDLGHILKASGVGAEIDPALVPRSATLNRQYDREKALQLALTGGDDYELCFTVPRPVAESLPSVLEDGCRITCIGQITDEPGVIRDPLGGVLKARAYTHF